MVDIQKEEALVGALDTAHPIHLDGLVAVLQEQVIHGVQELQVHHQWDKVLLLVPGSLTALVYLQVHPGEQAKVMALHKELVCLKVGE